MVKRIGLCVLKALILGACLVTVAPDQGNASPLKNPVFSPQFDTLYYDDGNPINMDTNENALFAVRFYPPDPFTLQAVYFMLRNENNTTDGCSLWVAPGGGSVPDWPAVFIGCVPAPLSNETWIQFDLTGPVYFEDDFYILLRQAGGPYPGNGFWVGLDYGTTTHRTYKSYTNGQAWLDEPTGDALIRAGGRYSSVPPGDYGDAPDSADCLYPWSLTGHFPTFWDAENRGTTSKPGHTGAHHRTVGEEWLGDAGGPNVSPQPSIEEDADDPFDPDGVPNDMDTDGFDDCLTTGSILIVLISIPPPAYLTFQVTIPPGAPACTRYANALFDLTMNGRWGGAGANGEAEWAVQNEPINIAPGGSEWVTVGPFPYGNGLILPLPTWMRITLTRQPINDFDWDGSAPSEGFAYGETEDWYIENTIIPKNKRKPALTCTCPRVVGVPDDKWTPVKCVVKNRGGPIKAATVENPPPPPANAAGMARFSLSPNQPVPLPYNGPFGTLPAGVDGRIPQPPPAAPNPFLPAPPGWFDFHIGANRTVDIYFEVTRNVNWVGGAQAWYLVTPTDPDTGTILFTDIQEFPEIAIDEYAFPDSIPQVGSYDEADFWTVIEMEDSLSLFAGQWVSTEVYLEDMDTGLRPVGYPMQLYSSDSTIVKVYPSVVDIDRTGVASVYVMAVSEGTASISASVAATDYPGAGGSVMSTMSVCGWPCDFNCDDSINVLDVVGEVNVILGTVEADSCQYWRSDCNADKTVNILDALTTVNCILDLGPCPCGGGTVLPTR